MLEYVQNLFVLANRYGLPIPLLVIAVVFGWLRRYRVRWTEREKYYLDILKYLGICRNTLSDRLDFYQEPGSEHNDDCTKTPRFMALQIKCAASFESLRDLTSVAAIFLSKQTINLLNQLESDHWNIAGHAAVCKKEYLELTLEAVEKAHKSVLSDAHVDLRKNRFSEMAQIIRTDFKS